MNGGGFSRHVPPGEGFSILSEKEAAMDAEMQQWSETPLKGWTLKDVILPDRV